MPAVVDDLETLKGDHKALRCFTSRLPLKKTGIDKYRASCPFHADSTPSFDVFRYQGVWIFKCLGCGATGNVVQFVEQKDCVPFSEAVRKVRSEAGLGDEPVLSSPKAAPEFQKQKPLITLPLATYAIAERDLATNQPAKDWLLAERGLSYETAERLHIGYRQNLAAKDEALKDVLDRGWFTFPSIEGDLVVCLKYRSIVRKAFTKKFGMANALFNAQTIDILSDVYVTEGEFDAAVLEQAGFRAVSIGSATTPITPAMIEELRLAWRVILAGDSDVAGIRVMDRLSEQLEHPDMLRLRWPEGIKDANELWLKQRDDLAGFRERIIELTANAIAKDAAITPSDVQVTARTIKDFVNPTDADMSDSALDGRLGEICQDRLSGLPLAYSYPALVTCAGTLEAADAPWVSEDALRSNLFCSLVGAPGSGKSQAIERAISCLGLVSRGLAVNGKFGSPEGMLAHLDNAKGRRLLCVDELGHMLDKANIEGSCFPYVLNTAYYQDDVLTCW
jgi:DNA primase